jgi:hypothetical protein
METPSHKAVFGSGSGIRCLFDPWIGDPGWEIISQDPDSGSGFGTRIRDEQHGLYFGELRNHFWVKILKFFDADPGSGMEKIRIRDTG